LSFGLKLLDERVVTEFGNTPHAYVVIVEQRFWYSQLVLVLAKPEIAMPLPSLVVSVVAIGLLVMKTEDR
jgi:hypothetical protein